MEMHQLHVRLFCRSKYAPITRLIQKKVHNPSGRTMALELTQPPTEISTRNISWGLKAAVA